MHPLLFSLKPCPVRIPRNTRLTIARGARGFIVEELPDKVAEAEVMRILMVQPVVHFPDGHILVAMEIVDINRRSIRSAFCRLLFDRLPSIHFLVPGLSDSGWQNAGYRAG